MSSTKANWLYLITLSKFNNLPRAMIMSSSSQKISPPPLKRRRLSTSLSASKIAVSSPPHDVVSRRSSLQIYSWNVNGIGPLVPDETPSITKYFAPTSERNGKSGTTVDKHSLRHCLRRWQWPEIVALQEVKISPSDTKTRSAVRRAANTALDDECQENAERPFYDAHFSLPRDKYNATGFGGKVYGVCTLIRRDLPNVSPVAVEWDLEGRVQIFTLTGTGANKGLVFINVYAVNGTDNDYRDPDTGKVTGTRHDRKRAVHRLLADEVAKYEEAGWYVIVAGDINISRTTSDSFPNLRMGEDHVQNRAHFERIFMDELQLLDTFRFKHGDRRKYTYRPTNKPWGAGGDRVDMILASNCLGDKITEADILDTEKDRGSSDHVPSFVILNF